MFVALITPPAPLMPNDSSSAASANRREQANISQMNEVAARDALLSHVSQDHCWGLTAAREMTILDIVPSSAFQVFTKLFDYFMCFSFDYCFLCFSTC